MVWSGSISTEAIDSCVSKVTCPKPSDGTVARDTTFLPDAVVATTSTATSPVPRLRSALVQTAPLCCGIPTMRSGAVAVSSPELAAAMARQVPRHPDGYVVELGGGTGSVTRALLASGVPAQRLVVIERDPTLHRYLSDHFPGVRVLLGDAVHLPSLLRRHEIGPVAAIVSSLPLLSLKRSIQLRIGAQAFAVLEPGAIGKIILVT